MAFFRLFKSFSFIQSKRKFWLFSVSSKVLASFSLNGSFWLIQLKQKFLVYSSQVFSHSAWIKVPILNYWPRKSYRHSVDNCSKYSTLRSWRTWVFKKLWPNEKKRKNYWVLHMILQLFLSSAWQFRSTQYPVPINDKVKANVREPEKTLVQTQ